MEYKLKLIKHSDINKNMLLNQVIKLKQQYWKYSYDSQVEWLDNNLSEDDMHVCLLFNTKLVAYLNAVNLDIIADGRIENASGVGNVCVDEAHLSKGWGHVLISFYNCILKENNQKGILLCQDKLVGFYRKCNWLLIDKRVSVTISEKRFLHNTMIVNWVNKPKDLLKINKPF